MIEFEFKLFSNFFDINHLSSKYSLEYLNDWLSYESELKYLFFFGDSDETYDITNLTYPKLMEDIICLLRHNTILTNEDKQYILSIYIEDAFVSIENNIVLLHIKLDSEFKKHTINSRIIQFLLNHIFNQCHTGLFKYGIIRPLTEEEKKKYNWIDEVGWSQKFLDDRLKNNIFDSLIFTNYTFITSDQTLIPKKPIYISNYNLDCYQVSKCIDLIKNDIDRYNKSIKFLEKKKKDLRKEKNELYKIYRDTYLTMLDNDNTKWNITVSSNS
jgi:hypothetical protein